MTDLNDKDVKIVESLKSGASSMIEKSKAMGGNLAEKVNSDSLKNIGEKSMEAMSNVKKFAYDIAYSKSKNEETEEEKIIELDDFNTGSKRIDKSKLN